ncbi:MAG: YdbL family protein [Alphaproteobacteria bacterium]|nr:YdbL family protein [Alphaproteobacteria bacterium]
MAYLLRSLLLIAAVTLATGGFASSANAQASLDQYRADGILAEKYDGYVVVRAANAPGAAKSLANEVNQKRKAVYEKRAREQGVSVAEVGKIYAAEIFAKAPTNTYFQQPNGSFVQK